MSDDRIDLPPPSAPNFNEKVREALSVYLGKRGDKLDRGVTLRDLVDAGVVELRGGYLAYGGKSPVAGPGASILEAGASAYVEDLTPPPTPTGVTVTAGLTYIFLETDLPVFTVGNGYARTLVYGVKNDVGSPLFTSAQLIHEFVGSVGSFPADTGTRWNLWLKWETVDGVLSTLPSGLPNGQVATTGKIGTTDLGPLIVEAGNLASGAVTAAKLASLSVDATKFANSIEPVTLVTSVPGTKSTSTVFNTTDGKLYRWNGASYVSTVASTDVSGTLTDAQLTAISAAKITGTLVTAQIADAALTTAKFASSIEPTTLVTAVPVVKSTNHVFNTTDFKLYRWNGTAYIATVATTDLSGTVTDAQIAGLAASKVTGTLSDSQLGAIASTKITGTLTDTQLAAISATKVTGQIVGTQITDGAIVTAKLAAGAVTASTIAANTITAGQIAAATITGTTIAAGTITGSNLVADTITASQIAAGAITSSELAAGAVIAGKITAGTIVSADIAANTITAGNIAAGTITATQIATDTITSGQIAAGAISTSELAALAVTAAKIAVGTITANEIAAATITGANIAATTIAAGNLVAGTITANEIAGATITGAKIAAGTITASNIAADTITAGQIAAGAVSTSELAAGAVTAAKLTLTDLTNIADNGDFEAGNVGWTVNSGAITLDAANAKSGSYVMAMTQASGTSANRNLLEITVYSGEEYYAEAWIKCTGTASAYVRLRGKNNAGAEVATPVGNTVTATSYTLSSVSSAIDAATVRLNVEVVINGGTGTVYVDGVRMLRRNNASLIVDGAISANKLAANSIAVGTAAIQNGAIVNAMIGDATIATAKIADAAITTAKIASATITNANIASATITGANIASATITNANIATATITSANIASATITGADIASATITGANIVDATITSAKIGAIGTANLSVGTISNVINGSVTTGARVVINSNQILVYDASNVLRVKIGNLA